jgi:NAD(P)-dependent dehydrogenase (short-subunit alcohol dehydrogenase family)/acyl carrier protein
MSRVMWNEHPEIPARIVDLDPMCDRAHAAVDLAEELLSRDMTESQVGFRGGDRFVARLVRHEATGPMDVSLDLSDGAYLVTGGLGGLGLAVARLLVDRGAKHLYLMGRSGASERALEALSGLASAGADVVVLKADVSDTEQVRAALAKIDSGPAELKGVVHSAGLIDDALIMHQDLSRLTPVLAPKVAGSWNLHTLTQGRDLDFFVLFSSASTLFGGAGQSNYTAANAFLDGLAHHRRALGQPALSINWGAWAQVGMAAAMESDAHARWAALGVGEIEPADGIEAMEIAMSQDSAQVAIVPINWRQWQRSYRGAGVPPFVADLVRARAGEPTGSSASVAELRAALTSGSEDRDGALLEFVTQHVAGLLGLTPEDMDVEQSVADLGFDSLMAMELKNRIELDLGMVVPVADLLDGPSVSMLTTRVLSELDMATGSGAAASPAEGDADWEEGEL